MLNDLNENDLVIVEKEFYCMTRHPSKKQESFVKINKGSILLVLDNNFGSTYKHRYTVFLSGSRKVFIKPAATHLDWSVNKIN